MAPGKSGRRYRSLRVAGAATLATSLVTGMVAGTASGATGWPMMSRAHAATATTPGHRMALMRAAAREFRVPVGLLLAISYNQTRWERQDGAPSIDGGYGLMDLTTGSFPADYGRGDPARPSPRSVAPGRARDVLGTAATLLHVPAAALRISERQNIRAATAVLADYARRLNGGVLPATLGGWYGAVAEYSGATTTQAAGRYADDVYATLRRGAALTTADGQVMKLAPAPGVRPDRAGLSRLGLAPATAVTSPVNCPSTLNCTFVPAAYAQDSSDPSNYGNYDRAGRPDQMRTPDGQTASMKINYIIIHDAES